MEAFVDTNVCLHWDLDKVIWRELLNVRPEEPMVVVFAGPVLAELDKHSWYDRRSTEWREHARKAKRTILRLLRDHSRQPNVSFAVQALQRRGAEGGDAELLATVLERKESGSTVALVTSDLWLTLQAKAVGITAKRPPGEPLHISSKDVNIDILREEIDVLRKRLDSLGDHPPKFEVLFDEHPRGTTTTRAIARDPKPLDLRVDFCVRNVAGGVGESVHVTLVFPPHVGVEVSAQRMLRETLTRFDGGVQEAAAEYPRVHRSEGGELHVEFSPKTGLVRSRVFQLGEVPLKIAPAALPSEVKVKAIVYSRNYEPQHCQLTLRLVEAARHA